VSAAHTRIEVETSSGECVIQSFLNTTRVGKLVASVSGKAPTLLILHVSPRFRRQGHARRLLAVLETLYGPAAPHELTPMGREFWSGIGRSE